MTMTVSTEGEQSAKTFYDSSINKDDTFSDFEAIDAEWFNELEKIEGVCNLESEECEACGS